MVSSARLPDCSDRYRDCPRSTAAARASPRVSRCRRHRCEYPSSGLGRAEQSVVTLDVSLDDVPHNTGVHAVAHLLVGGRVWLWTEVEQVG